MMGAILIIFLHSYEGKSRVDIIGDFVLIGAQILGC
jgi:hypothetical protein